VLFLFYRRYEDKILSEEKLDNIKTIRKYLLNEDELAKSVKPILWIHVPYEYNSRKWLSFGSRASFELNQPYLYLTVRTIIQQCEKDFTICIIDDTSFEKLIPEWSIRMNKISSPVSDKIRMLGLIKLMYIYGGMLCPISFLCIKSLMPLYERGITGNKAFLCEMTNRNITSSEYNFYPNIHFSGAPKHCETLKQLLNFMERMISNDFTAESEFLGEVNRWCNTRIHKGEINKIDGLDIGVKTIDDKQILLDDLLSQHYLNIYPNTYGIYIPADEVLKRNHYEWFARMSGKQVLESNTIIGNYLLVNLGEGGGKILEPIIVRPNRENMVGFWKTPLYPGLYGLKPNMLGDNLTTIPYPGR
jgi:hypothetical protein